MCFAPQRRALFRHRNFQKWSDNGVLCTFWLRNLLRATTACTFSTSQLPKVVRQWCAFRTRRFSEPTFRPSGASNHWKNTVFRDFPTFSRICIFFLLTLSLLLFSLLIFSLLSASALLCFSSVHIVGSLTSKLPSISELLSRVPKQTQWQAKFRTHGKFLHEQVGALFYPTRSCKAWNDAITSPNVKL